MNEMNANLKVLQLVLHLLEAVLGYFAFLHHTVLVLLQLIEDLLLLGDRLLYFNSQLLLNHLTTKHLNK